MSALPLFYLPPISWFSTFLSDEKSVVSISENFPKQTYRNRCKVLTANGVLDLIVPVQKGRSGKVLYDDIKISYAEKWQQVHVRTLISAYRNSPFFEDYFPSYESILLEGHEKLSDLNKQLLYQLFKDLGVSSRLIFSSDSVLTQNGLLKEGDFKATEYIQVFSDRFEFFPDLSILDLLFNLGPESFSYIQACRLPSRL